MTDVGKESQLEQIAKLSAELDQLKYQLLIQNVLLDDFFNNSPIGYLNLNEKGNIQKANVTLLDWLGYTRKELNAYSEFRKLVGENYIQAFDLGFESILKGGTTNNLEVSLRKKDDNFLDVYLSGKIVSAPGEEILIRFTVMDVSEKKLIQKDLAQKSKEILSQNMMMRKDLTLAARIQNSMLPHKESQKFISTLYLPLDKVGGDFFDILHFKDKNKIGIFISDVAGHGVASAFITAIIKSALHQMSEEILNDPSQLLTILNDIILSYSDGRFVTALYAVIDFEKSEMNCAHAGHPFPYVFTMDHVRELKLQHKRKPLGILSSVTLAQKNSDYKSEIVNLTGSSRILFFTDGLIEACSEQKGLQFYEDLLHDYLMENRTETSEKLVAGIFSDMMNFLQDSVLNDDICLVSVDLTTNR
ncbi:MAG: SpoIIE family protein phosphatase [Leptospira sp.]|nr:SpoIIE family protein phosphatase [Leptospira sp.]